MRIVHTLALVALLATTGCKDLVKSDTVASATVISVKPDRMILQSKEHFYFVSLEGDGDRDLQKRIKKGDKVQLTTHNGEVGNIILKDGTKLDFI